MSYEGERDSLGRRDIYGKYTYTNDDVYVGEWKKDKRHGKGIMTYASGAIYEGEFKDGKISGSGRLTHANGEEYTGDFKDGKRSGYGVHKWMSGAIYKGHWLNDERSGKGTEKFSNGDKYKGHWLNDLRNGEGAHTFSNGNVFKGIFKNDEPTRGEFKNVDGSGYKGTFKNGLYNGHGTMTLSNGTKYTGNWVDGIKDGSFELNLPGADGGICKGICRNNNTIGDWTCIYKNRDSYFGELYNEKRNGRGIFTARDGTVFEGNWLNGEISESLPLEAVEASPDSLPNNESRWRRSRHRTATMRNSRSFQGGHRKKRSRKQYKV